MKLSQIFFPSTFDSDNRTPFVISTTMVGWPDLTSLLLEMIMENDKVL